MKGIRVRSQWGRGNPHKSYWELQEEYRRGGAGMIWCESTYACCLYEKATGALTSNNVIFPWRGLMNIVLTYCLAPAFLKKDIHTWIDHKVIQILKYWDFFECKSSLKHTLDALIPLVDDFTNIFKYLWWDIVIGMGRWGKGRDARWFYQLFTYSPSKSQQPE